MWSRIERLEANHRPIPVSEHQAAPACDPTDNRFCMFSEFKQRNSFHVRIMDRFMLMFKFNLK